MNFAVFGEIPYADMIDCSFISAKCAWIRTVWHKQLLGDFIVRVEIILQLFHIHTWPQMNKKIFKCTRTQNFLHKMTLTFTIHSL